MTTISIASGADLDAAELMRSRMLIAANSGGGKSWCLRRIVEQTITEIPTIVIDRSGEFVTLRERFDVVVIGEGGDAEVSEATARTVAGWLVGAGVSAVVDLSNLTARGKGDTKKAAMRRYIREFLMGIAELPRARWRSVMVVVDEAHEYARQGQADVDGSLDALRTIMAECRKQGVGAILATQRITKLDKDVAAEANTLAIGRCALDLDLKRMRELLGDKHAPLTSLPPGGFYLRGPAVRKPTEPLGLVRVGPVLTTHPSPDERGKLIPPAPSGKLRAKLGGLRVELQEVAEATPETRSSAREVDTLRAQLKARDAEIVKLKAAAGKPSGNLRDVADAREQGRRDGHRHGVQEGIDAATAALTGKLTAQLEGMRARFGKLVDDEIAKLQGIVVYVKPKPPQLRPAPDTGRAFTPAPVDENLERDRPDSELGKGAETRILTAIAQHPGVSRHSLPVLSKTSGGGRQRATLGKFKRLGWIEEGDGLRILPAGREVLGPYQPLPTGRALADYWLGQVGKGEERRLLRQIIDAGSHGVARDALGSGGRFRATIGRFKRMVLVTEAAKVIYAVPEMLG